MNWKITFISLFVHVHQARANSFSVILPVNRFRFLNKAAMVLLLLSIIIDNYNPSENDLCKLPIEKNL